MNSNKFSPNYHRRYDEYIIVQDIIVACFTEINNTEIRSPAINAKTLILA